MILRLVLAFMLLSHAGKAQQTKQANAKNTDPNPTRHISVYRQAIAGNDMNTAATALQYHLAESGINDSYADTLAMVYLQQSQYPQCFYWTNRRLELHPENQILQEMKGICLDRMGRPKEAISIFESLFLKTRNPYHAYQLMEMQYGIKRLAECVETGRLAEQLGYKPEYRMTYSIGQQTRTTLLEAGICNIHALALFDLGDKANARKYLEKALALDSSFALARQNLNALSSMVQAEPGKKGVVDDSNLKTQPALRIEN
jgi:tetratricopeptide (TPR) repeat protein